MENAELTEDQILSMVTPEERDAILEIKKDTEWHKKKKTVFATALVTMIIVFAVFL
jgi:hypothetical protein